MMPTPAEPPVEQGVVDPVAEATARVVEVLAEYMPSRWVQRVTADAGRPVGFVLTVPLGPDDETSVWYSVTFLAVSWERAG